MTGNRATITNHRTFLFVSILLIATLIIAKMLSVMTNNPKMIQKVFMILIFGKVVWFPCWNEWVETTRSMTLITLMLIWFAYIWPVEKDIIYIIAVAFFDSGHLPKHGYLLWVTEASWSLGSFWFAPEKWRRFIYGIRKWASFSIGRFQSWTFRRFWSWRLTLPWKSSLHPCAIGICCLSIWRNFLERISSDYQLRHLRFSGTKRLLWKSIPAPKRLIIS